MAGESSVSVHIKNRPNINRHRVLTRMNTDNAVAATVSGAAAILAGLDPAFQHDQFLIGMKLAVADKRTISDAQGRPLLIVTSPSRLGRLVLGLLTAFLVFM